VASTPDNANPAPADGGQALYLSLINEQFSGGGDPCAVLRDALRQDHFILLAQKVVPLHSGAGNARLCEVLLRMQHEETNLLPPGGFFPVAEACGMMGDIDRWVVTHVLAWYAAQRERDATPVLPVFCINLSTDALDGPQFARFVRSELDRARVPASALCFEIAEADAIATPEKVKSFVQALKPAGCRFTLDAFGSIKVSFEHLKGLPLDHIKIDGVIIQNMLKSPVELARMRAIHGVCRKVGIRTIAEFVETQQTLDALREIGVDYAQGFGMALPAPINNLS
jgi:EAL domain-containing protein (putative c-di-GMP-specific phosphodiesterase class I)